MATELMYLLAAILFIAGIKGLTRIKTAARGNILAAVGMLIAVAATLYQMERIGTGFIAGGILAGAVIGLVLAGRVAMTAIPQLVAVFNGFGGAASALIAFSFYVRHAGIRESSLLIALASIIVGTITFTGSIAAFLKLQGWKTNAFPGSRIVTFLLAALIMIIAVKMMATVPRLDFMIILTAAALALGVLLVIPIGGADMPVVISLLNAYSGLAASATGFVVSNTLLVVAGALVGASGLILTKIMCKAMNRSLVSVLFGGAGAQKGGKENARSSYENVKEAGPEEAALLLESAKTAVIVPGYGMAVAQAQFAVNELAEILEKRGTRVKYAIHPVAGRMPGHMNVLLAEANVPYDKLYDLDSINPEFRNTDVVLVIGANDVTNPAASKEQGSPIYGMPILNTFEAKTVIIIKRSLSPGFAGIKNSLFEYPNAQMLFGDAKKAVLSLVQEIKGME